MHRSTLFSATASAAVPGQCTQPHHRHGASGILDEGPAPSSPRRPVLQRNTFMSPTKLTKSKLRLSNVPRLTSKFESVKIRGDRMRASPHPKQQDEPQITTLHEERADLETPDAGGADGFPGLDATSFLAPLPEI